MGDVFECLMFILALWIRQIPSLHVSPSSPLEVKLQRDGKNLGIHLKDGPHFLLVLGVEDGVVKALGQLGPAG